jgi:hypothetical protein
MTSTALSRTCRPNAVLLCESVALARLCASKKLGSRSRGRVCGVLSGIREVQDTFEKSKFTRGAEEYQAIQRVLESGQLTIGPSVQQFEHDFARKFDIKHALMVSSGSAADLAAVAALFYKREPMPFLRPAILRVRALTGVNTTGNRLRRVMIPSTSLNPAEFVYVRSAFSVVSRLR